MSELIDKGIAMINTYVAQWTSKYLFETSYVEETQAGHIFMTEFSLPTPSKPIPVATVKVFFTLPDLTDLNEKRISFRFENDSLIHQIDRTIRITQMEKWLEQILYRKSRTSRILFVGTQFEETRIKDQRMVDLFAEQVKVVPKQESYILPELLDKPFDVSESEKVSRHTESIKHSELQNTNVTSQEEQEAEVKILRETFFEVFRQVDTEDLGMISYDECLEVFGLLGLRLNKFQQDEILAQLDVTKTGIIKYEELAPLGTEMIHAIYSKNQAIKQLENTEEANRFQANLILLVDQIHDLYPQIVEECKHYDEDETSIIDYERFKEILSAKAEVLNAIEVQRILDQLQKVHPLTVPYLKIEMVFHDLVYSTLLEGLTYANNNKLEDYLIKIIQPYDTLNNGIVHINDIITALRISDKLLLSKVQLYIIQSFLKQDENQLVQYNMEIKFLSQMIKKFFNLDLLEQKDLLQANQVVEPTAYIKPRTIEQVRKDLQIIGK